MQNTKIIYSMKIMLKLRNLGFEPLATMPNPQFPEYNCWIFELNDDLREALN